MSSTDPILAAWDRLLQDDPERTLVAGGERRASRRQVAEIEEALVSEGRAAGRRRGELVQLCAANGPGFLAGLLAVRRLGCVAVLVDARTPAVERDRLARAFGVAAELQIDGWPDGQGWSLAELASEGPTGDLDAGTAVLKVTSGTTGAPQAVAVSSESLLADDRALSATMAIRDDDRILAAIPLSHSYGLCSVALRALAHGNLLVVPTGSSPFAAMSDARRFDVTFLPTVPAYLQGLVRAQRPPPAPDSLRLVVSAGAPIQPQTAVAFRERYRLPVRVFYGASECGGITFDREGGAAERGTLGTPVAGVDIELEPLLEPDSGPSPEDGGGVVRVRSPAVGSGYFPSPHPRLSGGEFRTSDLGSWTGGELRLHGRIDAVINVRGKNVDPVEIERLLSALEGVDEVAVVGIPDVSGTGQLVRAVVAGTGLEAERLREWCRRRLAEHKVPRSVLVVDRLPRTDRGKLDRRALVEMDGRSSSSR